MSNISRGALKHWATRPAIEGLESAELVWFGERGEWAAEPPSLTYKQAAESLSVLGDMQLKIDELQSRAKLIMGWHEQDALAKVRAK